MSERLGWGILGTGAIAKTFAKGVIGSQTGRLVAVGSRSQETAAKFADEFAIPHRHRSYDAILADRDVQSLYIATPHPMHAEWAIKAAQAGKHLLVEKPIGLNFGEAMAIVEAAEVNDVFLMEAFMYRCHPQTARLVELLREKVIGEVRVIHASFSFHWPKPWNATSRITANDMGGGGILDVGCYPMSMARLIAGVATRAGGKDFAEPIEVKGSAHLGATGVDEWACATVKFPDDILAQLSTGVQVNQENDVRIFGSEGSILVPTPWVPARDGGTTKIIVTRAGDKEPREILINSPRGLYSIEADTVAANFSKRQAPFPAMTWEDTLGNMRAIDSWRAAIGLTYESEKPEKFRTTTVAGQPLAPSRTHKMKYGAIPGLDKKLSRVILGCDNQTSFASATVMFDDYFSRGGNTFDTAHIYGGGQHERVLGQWIKHRGVGDQINIIVKGAHTPYCNPRDLLKQFDESLARLQIDHADIYMMHRDNPEIPVGEFVDAMNDLHRAGRVKAFGGSNWSIARVQAANDYAAAQKKQGFSVVSNNFSLARMVDPVWAGCISASDADSRAWFTKTQMPLLAWSSQARGFFLPGKAAPEKRDDAELVRCWYAADNFKRLDRVNELAKKRNVLPINIALAYVLNQPFPTFALIGPRRLNETRTSLPALDIELSPEELRWLNLEA